jgi:hypothetical protein
MNENKQYEFVSATGTKVIVTTRMGEDSARSEAMLFLWGPPNNVWCFNKGEGLHLIREDELTSTDP